MTQLKAVVRILYFGFRFLFYPIVALLTMAVPGTPQRIVGIFTLFFFGIMANFVWSSTTIGIFLFVLMQMLGMALAVLFMIWGADFEQDRYS